MVWVSLVLLSAFFLGIYDIWKKLSLKKNAVIPVLFFATLSGSIMFLPLLLISKFYPEVLQDTQFYIHPIELKTHFLIFIKSLIIASSWILAYFAMKNLPISIVTPIRASAPLWTLAGGILIFGEKFAPQQLIGLFLTLIFYFIFSQLGKKEGIHFEKNRWVCFIIIATLLGTASGLYDKFLIGNFPHVTVQAFFSFYLVLILAPVLILIWYPARKRFTPFRWKFSIPLIGIFLIIADFMYFSALTDPDSLISVISTIRRGSVVVSFLFGAILLKEQNKRKKALTLSGTLAGIFLIILGSSDSTED